MDLREIGWVVVDQMRLVQDRDQWRDLVNTIMNFHKSQGICWIVESLLDSRERLCSIKSVI
jgi:hypothetical protein